MERLVYTNANGQSITIGPTAPFILQNLKGVGDLSFEIQTDKAPYQDGLTYLDSVADKRDISFQIALLADNQNDIYEYKRMLSSIFNPKLKKGTLRYINSHIEKEIEVYLEAGPRFPIGDGNKSFGFQNVLINMVAVEPFWLDIFKTTELLAAIIPRFRFQLNILPEGIEFGSYSSGIVDIENVGDVATPVKIEFFGPVVDPRITNETTGQFIELITPLLEGEKMTITTAFGNKRAEITKVDGTIQNAFQYINLNSTFFQLERGTNTIRFTASAGSEDAEITITYRNRYVGI
ncbi:hypothetical protein BHU72_12035 [Desulfuribacillus stibiiarsenatis]|uniref:Phage tail protein n=1 Tax=Desulfuribacillus stibiiarsenatis TaxID=1390249 RepID=A0A1E5L7W8_9FIRM|nr:phage tail family protein [Desulfuribacillus stibiiarsenatis]OEH86257.1 hypothetical protein BHU72_12035 [Desulfuribacillus stibiiarsenatis]